MKRSILFLFIFISISGFSQDEVAWFQQGQEWYYRVFCLQTVDCGYIHYAVQENEFIGGEDAAVLLRTELQEGWTEVNVRTEYLRYENDTVWRYSVNSEQWHLLFDFGAEPSDVWTIQDSVFNGYDPPDEEAPEIPLFEVKVDSVDFWTEVPGSEIQNRRVIYTSSVFNPEYSYFSFGFSPNPIIEGIGPVGTAQDLIGNGNLALLPTYEARFQCFLDNGEIIYGEPGSPCFTLGTEDIQQVQSGLIYPNPAYDAIRWNDSFQSLTIYDINGKVVLQNTQAFNIQSLDVRGLNSGFYMVVVKKKNTLFSQKLIIER
jgi:hypothetical protein